jgi:ribosomal protein S18 acetylase RimI-like enzyme
MTKLDKTKNLRSLAAADLDRVIEIDAQYTHRSRRGFFEKRLASTLKAPQKYIFVGHQGAAGLDGYFLAHLLDGEFGKAMPVAVLDAIAVDSQARRHGIGRLLLGGAETVLRDKGVPEIKSEVDWRNTMMVQFLAATGFELAPRVILERDLTKPDVPKLPEPEFDGEENLEVDFSDPQSDDASALARDRIPCRSMQPGDLEAIVKIAHHIDGGDHRAYYTEKMDEAISQSGVRVSLVAEQDGRVAGFVMARVDFGEFGRMEPAAVIDSFGVDPGQARHHVGSALIGQLTANLRMLRCETVHTAVDWSQSELLAFLRATGFAPSQRLSFTRKVM